MTVVTGLVKTPIPAIALEDERFNVAAR